MGMDSSRRTCDYLLYLTDQVREISASSDVEKMDADKSVPGQ
jgi:hypothetical protein